MKGIFVTMVSISLISGKYRLIREIILDKKNRRKVILKTMVISAYQGFFPCNNIVSL